MTETRRWLEERRAEFLRRVLVAGLSLTVGLGLLALSAGLLLGRLHLYRSMPASVLLGWLGLVGALGWGVFWSISHLRQTRTKELARHVEVSRGLRHGSIGGLTEWEGDLDGSSLAHLADTRVVLWLAEHGLGAFAAMRRRAGRSVAAGATLLASGATLFFLAGPTSSGGSQFWSPLTTMLGSRGPVLIDVDRTEVQRGDSVVVSITAVGRSAATLWLRAPGEPWAARSLELDSVGAATVKIGPLESDRFMRATSGSRNSDTLHVHVLLPAFLTALDLIARYPRYLERADEPLVAGPDPVRVPVGTRIVTEGRITLDVESAEWHSAGASVPLASDGERFAGTFGVSRSASWQLRVAAKTGQLPEAELPVLYLIAVPDSAPTVNVPVPGADTAAPLNLKQPMVIDANDDNQLTRLELVSWRTSKLGVTGERIIEQLPMPRDAADRVVVQWILDLNERGFLPGDTAHFKVRAHDNAPRVNIGESREYLLWLPSMAELREAMRDRSRSIDRQTDSLLSEQERIAQSLQDLSAERERATEADGSKAGENTADDLQFNSVERAQELSEEQRQTLERAENLTEELRRLSDEAWAAGLTDPEFHKQLEEIRDLLDKAVTDEMRERLEALRKAMEDLDADGVREALRRLAKSAKQLREQLQRSKELFERAAIEGEMTTLGDDAEELTQRQNEWNQSTANEMSDSALAERERALTEQADSLAQRLEELTRQVARSGESHESLDGAAERAQHAAERMQQAAQQAQSGQRQSAKQSGEAASKSLQPLASSLQQRRDQLRQEWRQEVLDAMDRSLVETASLAQGQHEIMERLNRGESGDDIRGAQAANRSGVDQLLERLQGAAGKNALVSPQLGSALGFAKLRMSQALDQLQRANPNTRRAGELAGEALDGLNALAHALLRARSDVAGAQSGSGLSEAMERLAQMAQQQGQMNNEANGMLSLMPKGGSQLLQQLQALAQRQRALGNEMERLQADGEIPGANELAQEAKDLARELEAARLDRKTVERQERLFRRLLDAGRTLRSDEEDQREERVSETADPNIVKLPPSGRTGAANAPRYKYPTWDDLRSLSPEQRRLILDYFRRLNDARRP
ncbi:MAG: hypothetical protein ACE5HT_13835 [Gemmatimonadales bacterium]